MKATDIMTVLNELGAPKSNLGYMYTIDSLLLMQEDVAYFSKVTALYRKIAKKHNSLSSRVERAIRHEAEIVFSNCDEDTLNKVFGSYRKYNNKVPNKEFLVSLYYYIYYNIAKDNEDNEDDQ